MSWVAVGVGAASLIAGGIQAISGSKRRKNAEKAINELQDPTYTPNKSITDYYNKALQRANVNPYQSAQYQYGIQQGARNTAMGVNALQDRNSAVGGISRLIALQNENSIKQGIAAEQEGDQKFGQLGAATQLKGADDQYGFQVNQLMPYQKKLNMYIAKMGGGTQTENAGYQNIQSGIGTIGGGLINYYGNSGGGGNSSLTNLGGSQYYQTPPSQSRSYYYGNQDTIG